MCCSCTGSKLPTEVKDDIKINDEVAQWAESYVKRAISAGAFSLEKNDTFRATDNITRGEVCLALAKYIGTNNSENTTEVTTKTEVVTNANGETVTETTTTEATETTTRIQVLVVVAVVQVVVVLAQVVVHQILQLQQQLLQLLQRLQQKLLLQR